MPSALTTRLPAHVSLLPAKLNHSTAEMICAGVLPIMQMRNVMPPMALIARRIPRHVLEITYTIKLPVLPGDAKDVAGNAILSPQQLLESYCQARGLFRARALGESDMPRAARQILKDFTDGRLLFCHPPSGLTPEVSGGLVSWHVVQDVCAPLEYLLPVTHVVSSRCPLVLACVERKRDNSLVILWRIDLDRVMAPLEFNA